MQDRLLTSAKCSEAPTHWFSGQRIRHVGNLDLGRVAAVDFGESLVAVQINETDPLVWWRMENVVETHSIGHGPAWTERERETARLRMLKIPMCGHWCCDSDDLGHTHFVPIAHCAGCANIVLAAEVPS